MPWYVCCKLWRGRKVKLDSFALDLIIVTVDRSCLYDIKGILM